MDRSAHDGDDVRMHIYENEMKWKKKLHDAAHENVTAYVYVGAKLCAASSPKPVVQSSPAKRAWILDSIYNAPTNERLQSIGLTQPHEPNQRSHEYFLQYTYMFTSAALFPRTHVQYVCSMAYR